MSEHLDRAKQTANADAGGGVSTSNSPDGRTIPTLLAAILDALIAIAEQPPRTEPDPGPCWASANVVWPGGIEPRCELRAGHAGAHECIRQLMGGTAVWTDDECAQ